MKNTKYIIRLEQGKYKLFYRMNNEVFLINVFNHYPTQEEIALAVLLFNRGMDAQKVFIKRNIDFILGVGC